MDPNAQKSASDARKQSAPRPPKFDTMQAVENLKEAEFREQQAVAIVETIRDSQVEFATRDDLHAVRDDLRTELEKMGLVLRGEIDSLRSEMCSKINSLRSEMCSEINSLRSEMRNEINSLRSEMRNEMRAEMQEQLATMYWRLLIGAGIIAGVVGTIVTLAGGV